MKFAQGDRVRITKGSCEGLEGTVWGVAKNGSCEVVFNRNLSGGFTEEQMEFCEGHGEGGWELEQVKFESLISFDPTDAPIVGNPYYTNEKGELCKIPDSDFCADCGQHGQAHGPHSDQVQHHFVSKVAEK